MNVNVPFVGGVGVCSGTPGSIVIPAPQTIDEALDVIRYVAEKQPGKLIVVLDEMERIDSKNERDLFAEFIKNISTLDNDVRFIFCGIASDVDELLNSHPSAGRILDGRGHGLQALPPESAWGPQESARDRWKTS